jgi:hypothetical protein
MNTDANLQSRQSGGVTGAEGEVSNEQDSVDEVPVTTRFGIPGQWRPLPVDEPESEEKMGDASLVQDGGNPTGSSAGTNGVFRFQELMEVSIKRPKDIVEGLVAERQNVLLMGRFGVGKTMFGTQLSLHLATGREFLGLKVPRRFRVMYLDFENDLGDMKHRVATQRANLALSKEEEALLNDNWIYVDAGDHDNLLHDIRLDVGQAVLDPLITVLQEARPEVVILDNLGLVTTKGDLEKPEEAKRFYANLQYLSSVVGSLKDGAIIVFHHLTKPGEQGTSPTSLLTSPYEYISRARGTGRVLDFARSRLALAEEMVGSTKCHVVNGINRSTTVSPLILQFNPETLSFERHEDTKFRFDAVFGTRPRGKEIYRQLPEEFKFSDVETLKNPNTGKLLNKGTLSETLRLAVANDFIRHDLNTKLYKKVFDPQSD